MAKTGRIQYLHDETTHAELVLCEHSSISYPTHSHVSVLTAGMVLEGGIILTDGDGPRLCQEGAVFGILPYTPHSIRADGPYTLLSLCIQSQGLPPSGTGLAPPLPDMLEARMGTALPAPLLECLEGLCAVPQPEIDDPSIERLKRQLEQHPESRVSIDEMAQAAFVSKYHLIRRFKQAVGLTPHQFQMQNRVRKAQRLLGRSGTMTEAALTAGFCDQSHFIRLFERYVGLTPSAYLTSCASLRKLTPKQE